MERLDWPPTASAALSFAAPEVVPAVEAVDAHAFQRAREREALDALPVWRFRARRAARKRVRRLAAGDFERERVRLAAEHVERQAELDREWALLLANDPPAVRAALIAAYAALDVQAAPAVVEGSSVTTAVLLPPDVEEPPVDEALDPLVDELAGIAFAVARATCAAAPGIERSAVLVLRDPGGTSLPRPLLHGSLPRAFALRHRPPTALETLAVLIDEGALFRRALPSREPLPLELPPRSDLRAALALAALRGG